LYRTFTWDGNMLIVILWRQVTVCPYKEKYRVFPCTGCSLS
jgi:hypothetical protein